MDKKKAIFNRIENMFFFLSILSRMYYPIFLIEILKNQELTYKF